MNILNNLIKNPVKRLYVRKLSWNQTKEERLERNSWFTDKPKSLLSKKAMLSLTSKQYHPEMQYLDLISNIMKNGEEEKTRNGVTKSIIGASMRFPLGNSEIPILTTKKLAWKSCLKELLWFISGDTDNKTLVKQGVNIWNDNASREFLDSRNLRHLKQDDLGPIYGYQWRYYNLPYIPLHVEPNVNKIHKYPYGCNMSHEELIEIGDTDLAFFGGGQQITTDLDRGIDQLANIIKCLKDPEERYSRRLIMTAWNPEQIDHMALPPCHVMSQFSVLGNKLHCTMYQRSGDVGLGVPFNIASYSFLTILLAKHCGLEPGEFIHFIGNAHIYKEHEEMLLEQIKREPKEFPTCVINKRDSIDDYVFSDFRINNYKYHPPIKMNMIA